MTGLKLELDYLAVGAAITPFSIGHIGREAVTYATGDQSYRWTISINWPEGQITFEASGFTQRLLAEPVLTPEQALSVSARTAAMIHSPYRDA